VPIPRSPRWAALATAAIAGVTLPIAALAAPASAAGGGAIAARAALGQIGKPYAHNASGPRAFDCSGLVDYAWRAAGVSLPHSSSALARLHRVPLSRAIPGDVVGRPGHVGIYIGGGRMVHAPFPGAQVRIDSVAGMSWAARP
jgi:cell wall-associated NlpC family hydrolase